MCLHAVSTTVHSPLLGLTRLKAVSNLPGDYKALKYYVSNYDKADPDNVKPANIFLLI
jgi:hypothetical protein